MKISDLSVKIKTQTNSYPTSNSLKELGFEIARVDIKELIIYNFKMQDGTWLKHFILSIFNYWRELNYNDWNYIFRSIEGNQLGEYYMTHISKTYLGIDPKFRNTKGIREKLFPKKYLQTEKSPDFITNLNNSNFKLEKELLNENSIKLEKITKVSDKLFKEMIEFNKNIA